MSRRGLLVPPQKPKAPKIPKRRDDRIILHFDYDCFYASVFENENPALRSLPLGIKQKSILATCNYVARARGVKKLMLISEAQKLCPDLVLMNGEDLTRFRVASKKLWLFLRSHSWNNKVERLGLDEVFLDMTDIIEYNQQILNPNALAESFFQLERLDPERGFQFSANSVLGCTYPELYPKEVASFSNLLYVRLMLASHLAGYLRLQLEAFGYTSTCGVSTNKVLAKLAGSVHKPKNQTTLLGLRDEDVQGFMDSHQIRKIPGLGSKTSLLIENHILSKTIYQTAEHVPHDEEHPKFTTHEVLAFPDMSPELLEKIIHRPGTERGIGAKLWSLLHGVDEMEVKEAQDVPTQISIEDTYVSNPINTPQELLPELRDLSISLLERMRHDLVDDDPSAEQPGGKKWLAHPKTLCLSTRVKPPGPGPNGEQAKESFTRSSKSQYLPNFVFNLQGDLKQIAQRLVHEAVLPLFTRLHSERNGWNLALINICATNIVLTGNETGIGSGRDIAVMFRTQDAKLREWKVYDEGTLSPTLVAPGETPVSIDGRDEKKKQQQQQTPSSGPAANVYTDMRFDEDGGEDEDPAFPDSEAEDCTMAWEAEGGSRKCLVCGHSIPAFAVSAHERFHVLGDS
ncbi:uncharacterized protein BCR38DRAFT_433635 [Pseudomassariella vexata]|uniref:UmuC domain-containing protein n=1 Tax=Pseudomassariella vexata TaxID=1141098 RepID=A0A1Y2DXG3_9PEZI|nr:uncharacterized protein BCR38DRAFT_433635 [Pseudomassariella vexata]ORY63988.1 hypothetical protein BCR38DRAFT_433635 [Pseudomassariella vexata]